jgi:hypothetical protein
MAATSGRPSTPFLNYFQAFVCSPSQPQPQPLPKPVLALHDETDWAKARARGETLDPYRALPVLDHCKKYRQSP